MALVSITEAADLVRMNQADLYRDVDNGRVQATRTADGGLLLDTAELLRIYGVETGLGTNDSGLSPEQLKIAVLEERTRSLERALTLEAELRKVKDQVASELRARLADKDNVIKVLESKVLFLEYDKQVTSLPIDEEGGRPAVARDAHAEDQDEVHGGEHGEEDHPALGKSGWWSRLLGQRSGSSLPK